MHKSLPDTIDYIEMPSRDLTATKLFFNQLFGWSFEDYGPEYCAFDDGRMAGGFCAAEGVPLIVFYHAELERKREEVMRAGGKISREIFEFPGGRRFHFQAPGGGEFAIWSDK